MNVGRIIFFDKTTGEVIVDTQEKSGFVSYKTPDYYIERYKELSERIRDTFDYLELEYGQYSQDFIESQGNFRVNPTTLELEFSYPDPNAPTEPQPYQIPLSEEVVKQKQQLSNLLLESARKDIINTTLQEQNAEVLLRLARNNIN